MHHWLESLKQSVTAWRFLEEVSESNFKEKIRNLYIIIQLRQRGRCADQGMINLKRRIQEFCLDVFSVISTHLTSPQLPKPRLLFLEMDG
jgi:hypothetical protein